MVNNRINIRPAVLVDAQCHVCFFIVKFTFGPFTQIVPDHHYNMKSDGFLFHTSKLKVSHPVDLDLIWIAK